MLAAASSACSSDPADEPSGQGGDASSTAGVGAAGGSGATGGGSPMTGEFAAAVRSYDYAFDLASGAGDARLTLEVPPPGGDCTSLSCGLPVDDVGWAGGPTTSAEVSQGKLAACGTGIASGALEITASASVPDKTFLGLDVGYSRKTNAQGGTFSYLLSWMGGCDHFGPCDDAPAALSEFHFEVTHAAGEVVLCPGTLVPGETVTRCDLAGTLAPTYSAFAIAADTDWVRTPFAEAAGVDLVFYEAPGGQLAQALEPAVVSDAFVWLTELLGPFPYGSELRFAGAATVWYGFEHPANVLLFDGLPTEQGGFANPTLHVLLHEVVHQWAGDRTTLAETADFVWKEATAEYLTYVFEDEHRPAIEAATTLAYWDDISLQVAHHPRPTDDPTPPVESFYGDVYGPGPLVLYVQLESLLGRAVVLEGIQAFLAEPGARSVDDLRAALEAASGEDLAAYFDAWVFGSGAPTWPKMQVEASQTGDQVTVTVTQNNPGGKLFGCKVEVQVQGADQSALAVVDFGVAPTASSASTTVTLAQAMVSTVLDPRRRLIAHDGTAGVMSAPQPHRDVWIF
jgi:aminopeptidase N